MRTLDRLNVDELLFQVIWRIPEELRTELARKKRDNLALTGKLIKRIGNEQKHKLRRHF